MERENRGREQRAIGGGEVFADADVAGLVDRVRLRVNPSEVELSVPAFHLTQAIQDMDGSVPIIAGREAPGEVWDVIAEWLGEHEADASE